jgi:hypothetical protein
MINSAGEGITRGTWQGLINLATTTTMPLFFSSSNIRFDALEMVYKPQ